MEENITLNVLCKQLFRCVFSTESIEVKEGGEVKNKQQLCVSGHEVLSLSAIPFGSVGVNE